MDRKQELETQKPRQPESVPGARLSRCAWCNGPLPKVPIYTASRLGPFCSQDHLNDATVPRSAKQRCAACGRDLALPVGGCSSCLAASEVPVSRSSAPDLPSPSIRGMADPIIVETSAEVGEDVLYVLPDGPNRGQVRPAKIILLPGGGQALIYVFTAGSIDGIRWVHPCNVLARYSHRKEPDTWHRRR